MSDAPAPPPALVASAEGEPVTDLDHARYDRDGWMESALRAQGYVGELQGRLAAALARAERLEEALKPFAKLTPSSLYPDDGSEAERYSYVLAHPADDADFTGEDLARARAALAHPAPAEET